MLPTKLALARANYFNDNIERIETQIILNIETLLCNVIFFSVL